MNITAEEIKDQAHYQSGENVSYDKAVNGSLGLAGNTVNTSSKIDGISFLAGENASFNGISEYLFSAGNVVVINGTVEKDSFLAGNMVTIGKNALLKRDLTIGANVVTINGIIERDVTIYAATVNIENATIRGNVKINTRTLNIKKGVIIEKTLEYNEDATKAIDNDAQIKTIRTYQNDYEEETFLEKTTTQLISWFCIMIVTMVFLFIMPKTTKRLDRMAEKYEASDYVTLFGKGFISMIAVPIMIFLLIISTIGSALGIILIPLYIIAIYTSVILSGYILGTILWEKALHQKSHRVFPVILGTTIIFLMSLLPIVGMMISIVSLFIAFGILSDLFFRREEK